MYKTKFNGICNTIVSLKERDAGHDQQCDISRVPELIPSSFFISSNNGEEIHVSFFRDVINGNETVNKLIFNNSGVWQLVIGGRYLDLDELLIDPHFCCSCASVQNICNIVPKVLPCNGKEKENWHPEESKLDLYRVEYLGVANKEICCANNCKRVIPFTAITSTCRNCQYTFEHTKFKNNALK